MYIIRNPNLIQQHQSFAHRLRFSLTFHLPPTFGVFSHRLHEGIDQVRRDHPGGQNFVFFLGGHPSFFFLAKKTSQMIILNGGLVFWMFLWWKGLGNGWDCGGLILLIFFEG